MCYACAGAVYNSRKTHDSSNDVDVRFLTYRSIDDSYRTTSGKVISFCPDCLQRLLFALGIERSAITSDSWGDSLVLNWTCGAFADIQQFLVFQSFFLSKKDSMNIVAIKLPHSLNMKDFERCAWIYLSDDWTNMVGRNVGDSSHLKYRSEDIKFVAEFIYKFETLGIPPESWVDCPTVRCSVIGMTNHHTSEEVKNGRVVDLTIDSIRLALIVSTTEDQYSTCIRDFYSSIDGQEARRITLLDETFPLSDLDMNSVISFATQFAQSVHSGFHSWSSLMKSNQTKGYLVSFSDVVIRIGARSFNRYSTELTY